MMAKPEKKNSALEAEKEQVVGQEFLINVFTTASSHASSKYRLQIPVQVIDVRAIFGRFDYLIKPVHGTGQSWVGSLYEKD
mgnify:CR=1 FL=1